MQYKLIALDIDFTLLNSERKVTERVRAALHAAQQADVQIVICTGRMYRTMRPVADSLGLDDLILIAYGGAQIWRNDELIHSCHVPSLITKEVLELAHEGKTNCQVFFWDDVVVEMNNSYTDRYSSNHGFVAIEIPQLRSMSRIDTPKVMMLNEPEVLDSWQTSLRKHFGDKLIITKSGPTMLEMNHPNGSKGKALEALAGMLGIDRQECIAMGDATIDISMLEYAGLGVAMENADEETKAHADYICPSCDEDGVAAVIEKYILGGSE